ncbi:CypX Cytochrome P450 [Candidatus Nanopelagicaceae bacterium]
MAVVKVPITREITGHKAVRQALRDTETYSSDLQGDADVRDYRQLPLEVDPPRHHLYRAALTPHFVKPAIEKNIPEFERISRELIRNFLSNSGEVISELALPLVMENLGVIYNRPQDVAEWISWGPDVWTAAGPTRSGDVLHSYLDRIYAEALVGDSDDIWREIARLEIDGKVISADEFRGIAGVLLAGGRDTVVKLFTGIIWHLGNSPEDFHSLKEDSTLIDGAIQEFLRFLTPLPAMARTTTPESTASELPEDRYVQISFISGNFDETVFDNPGELNIRRPRNPHLSFGFGPHTCLGNHIAEIEAKVFLKVLLEEEYNWKVSPESKIKFYEGVLAKVPDHMASLWISRNQ